MIADASERAEPLSAAAPSDPFDTEAAARIAAAAILMKQASPQSRNFFNAFFRAASPEDVARYPADALVALADSVRELTAARKPGETLVLFSDFTGSARSETMLVAVNDDMPFLLNSVVGEMTAHGVRVHALFHPIMTVARDAGGRRSDTGASTRESVIVLLLDSGIASEQRETLAAAARNVFRQVWLAVRDWHKMRERLHETVAGLKRMPSPAEREQLRESVAFLEWLGDNHFTFLGSRDYAYRDGEEAHLDPIDKSGLGVLSDIGARVIRRSEGETQLSPEARDYLLAAEPLIITKSNERSVVHRRVTMDYVGVRTFDAQGRLVGERRFVGLFTSSAYNRLPQDIPLLRLKVDHVLKRAGLPPDSHDGKALAHILDDLSARRDVQVNEDELFATALGILRWANVRRFASSRASTASTVSSRFSSMCRAIATPPMCARRSTPSSRVPFTGGRRWRRRHSTKSRWRASTTSSGATKAPRPEVDLGALEGEIRDAIRTWEDGFADALVAAHGDEHGARLFRRHAPVFPPRYRDAVYARGSGARPGRTDRLSRRRPAGQGARLRHAGTNAAAVRLKLYVAGAVAAVGIAARVRKSRLPGDRRGFLPGPLRATRGSAGRRRSRFPHGARGRRRRRTRGDQAPLRGRVSAVIARRGRERRLQPPGDRRRAGLARRRVLRRSPNILRQAGIAFSQDYMEQALTRNPDIAGAAGRTVHVARSRSRRDADRDARRQDLSPNASRRRWTTCPAWTTTASSAASAT